MAQLAKGSVVNPHDLGSSPRSVLSPYYFSVMIPMQRQRQDVPCILKNQYPRAPGDQIKGIEWRNTINSGQHCYTLVGKSNGPEGHWA